MHKLTLLVLVLFSGCTCFADLTKEIDGLKVEIAEKEAGQLIFQASVAGPRCAD
jgi:hypothetical protein